MASVCGGGGTSNCSLNSSLPSGIYKSNGNLSLTSVNFNANKNYVFIINGSLTINGNVTANNGTAFFTTSGNIFIDKSVGSAPGPKPASGQVQGLFSSDQNFIVNGNNDCANPDKMLNLDGAIVINASGRGGTFTNQRNLCANNSTVPAFTITPRLDMILNAPSFLKTQNTISNEVAP